MANKEQNPNGANMTEGTQEGQKQEEQTVVVTTMPQKTGVGTTLKVVGGLLLGAAFTGLGWLLHGWLGGSDEDGSPAAEAEHPEE